ncbi:MAG: helicase-related protein [Caldilineaceae bacterium]|nr:helicase-related protein [Caldilineaceae bacterium]
MLKLEEVETGSLVEGLVPDRTVSVAAVIRHGSDDIEVVYTDAEGNLGRGLLSRADQDRLSLAAAERSWPLDADGDLFKLVLEARRIESAHLFDPYVAINTADIDPLPHQIEAVYQRMLPLQPLRFLLADDPGAGKTIMSGLYIRELMIRGDVERVLIIAPGSLVVQWQDELWHRFGLEFDILSREMVETVRTGNPFTEKPRLIARLDQVCRSEELLAKLDASRWDLIVVDEAHKMSAHYFGNKLNKTMRYQLGERLGLLTRHLLLLTATPHSGKPDSFLLFLALLDEDRFGGRQRNGGTPDVSDIMRRSVKENLLTFDGRPLFPERRAYSAKYELSPLEQNLYDEVTRYVREGMDKAKEIEQKDRRRGLVVGFALTALQRRLASSPEAIYRSLRRRCERLENRLVELEAIAEGKAAPGETSRLSFGKGLSDKDIEFFDFDEYDDEDREQLETEAIDQATAAATVPELRKEIATLHHLAALAAEVRSSGTDRKWDELSSILQSEHMTAPDGTKRKIIVFTEHKDTLEYLRRRIVSLLGGVDRVVVIHGSVRREDRRRRQDAFVNVPEVEVMVATDAAGEGINLQRANLMVNYDLPWNPNRIEQRFGRIHRIGQTEVCHLWNLVAYQTREGAVFHRLLQKIEEQRRALGQQVYDVLGDSFIDRSLRDLLIEAIQYGDLPEVRERQTRVIDQEIGSQIQKLVSERSLVIGDLPGFDIQEIRDDMERAKLRKLQPGFILRFFIAALNRLGGRIVKREKGQFEITRVPARVRTRERELQVGGELQPKYERVTFEKELADHESRPQAQLLAVGHPLLEAVVKTVIESHGALLQRGAILVDPHGTDNRLRGLTQLTHLIEDGRGRTVSRQHWTVEIPVGGDPEETGAARHHDLKPITDEERGLISDLLEQSQVDDLLSDKARIFAITSLCRPHLDQVHRAVESRVRRTRAAVEERLWGRIQYWDAYANKAHKLQLQGRRPKGGFTAGHARNLADELQARLDRRRHELDLEQQLTNRPPEVVGGALVVPKILLDQLSTGDDELPTTHSKQTQEVDERAVAAVMAAEQRLGRQPKEMSHSNPGYDIESRDPETGMLYFIEVKGRIEGSDTVTVSGRQVIHSQNVPDHFILAVGEVPTDREAKPTVRYASRPFEGMEVPFDRFAITVPLSELNLQEPS